MQAKFCKVKNPKAFPPCFPRLFTTWISTSFASFNLAWGTNLILFKTSKAALQYMFEPCNGHGKQLHRNHCWPCNVNTWLPVGAVMSKRYRICRILKISFNNRQRRIESLSSFSNLFLNCSTTTPLNACTRFTRRGIGGASTKIL